MPYNSTAIPPTEEITGSTSLPLSRVKRILSLDPEINVCSASAAFTITIATELFIRYLTSSASTIQKTSSASTTSSGAISKPRRNLQYRDFSAAVSRIDNLEFLSDIVPRTTTYKDYKAQRAVRSAKSQASRVASGSGQGGAEGKQHQQQMKLDGRTGVPIRPALAPLLAPAEATDDGEEAEGREELMQTSGGREAGGDEDRIPIDVPAPDGPRDGLVFQHYRPDGEVSLNSRAQAGEEDVEMESYQ